MLFKINRSSKPLDQQQTPLKVLMPLSQSVSNSKQVGTQYGRPNSNVFKLSSTHKQDMKILKAVSKRRAPDTKSLPGSPTSSTNNVSPKAVHKHDQSIESGQHTSTRAFFESLTKPTHEDTSLPPTPTTLSRKSFQHQTFQRPFHPPLPHCSLRPHTQRNSSHVKNWRAIWRS